MRRLSDFDDLFPGRADAGILLLEGCRLYWSTAAADRARFRCKLAAALGSRTGRIVPEGFEGFAATLHKCARCPMRAGTAGTRRVSRDEALVLGLVAGLQHGDDSIAAFCACELTCPAHVPEILCAAASLAMALKVAGLMLLPLSIADIHDHSCRPNGAGSRSCPIYH